MNTEKTSGTVPGFRRFDRSQIETPLCTLFEEVARRYPDNLAVVTKNHSLSYSDLLSLTSRIAANLLHGSGLEAGQRVALMLEHDAPMVAGLFGVLKAGMAYVPLDPEYPHDRLEYILQDSGAVAIVAESKTCEKADSLKSEAIHVINIDELLEIREVEFPRISARDVAYILYTSGSTGKPKGVIQNHRNVGHFIRNYTNNLQISSHDRMTLLSSYSFDAAVMAIYGAMLNGASLFPKSVASEGFSSIGSWLIEHEITIYHSTPTVFRYFLDTCDEATRFPHVRRVVMGGEAVVRSDIDLYRTFFSDECLLINGLGPTESTVTLQNFIDKTAEITANRVPVGFPVEDTEVFLLDDNGRPSDSEGEIIFKSEHLALGYQNLEELTDRVFVTDPENPSLREYHSGDLGRFLSDGKLEFLGRKDFQVKIHGVRIELGEIESVLNSHEGIKESVVIAILMESGKSELVAYLKAVDGSEPDLQDVRGFVRRKLPSSMCPGRFAVLDAFPLTPTGKINRKELESMGIPQPLPRAGVEDEELSEIEKVIVDGWKGLLGLDLLSVKDDFFDVGGDSLTAVQACDLLEERLGKKVNLVTLFQYRTARSLGKQLEFSSDGEEDVTELIVPLNKARADVESHLFCICGVYLYEPLARLIGNSHAVSGIFLPVEEIVIRENRDLPSLEELASMYGDAVKKVQPRGPYRLAGLSFGGLLAYELARQFTAAGEKVELLAMFDAMLPNTVSALNKIRAHLILTLRQGPGYLIDKVAGRLRNTEENVPEFVDANLDGKKRDMAVLRNQAYDRAAFVYRDKMPSYEGSAVFFRAGERSEYRELTDGPDCGWKHFVTGSLQSHEIPGDHITMLQEPNVQKIAAVLKNELDRLVAGRDG